MNTEEKYGTKQIHQGVKDELIREFPCTVFT